MLKVLKFSLRLLLISALLISFSPEINAQQLNINQIDFSSIKVNDLTDAQVKQFIGRAKATGMSMQELEGEAISRGMPYNEVLKLRERIREIESGQSATNSYPSETDTRDSDSNISQRKDLKENTIAEEGETLKVFGYDLFQKEELTFEPSLNIPTPQNYQLGPGDELIIEVWGASQSQSRVTVNPEGQIIVPDLGPINIGGQTIEKATTLIINRLSTIYSGLKGTSPNTFAQVSIGNVRSIKVTVAGDAYMPGTYTIPSFATAFNALYLAGGPDEMGSFREIRVIRNGQLYQKIDLYDFLLRGETALNVRLQDEDIVFIAPFQNRVTFYGEVVRPAIYELKEGETLDDLIEFSGGFSARAYSKHLVVNRKTDSQKKLLNVDKELFSSFLMNNGDEIKVGEILDRYENRVTVKGAVFREGEYGLTEGMTVSELIKKAEGLREDAFTNRASIYRLRDNLEVEIIDIDLKSILEDPAMDLQLKREDLLVISSILELKQERTVNIIGEVQKPGSFPYADNISLGELIRKAGGLKHSASLAMVEVARRVQNRTATESSETISEVFNFPINENLSINDEGSSFKLEPFDIVFVRTSPGYKKQEMAVAEGEFTFPGSYAIARKDDRISDLVARAGGLTPEAFLPGATLLRKIDDTQREQAERIKDLEGYDLEIDDKIDEQTNNSHQPIGINLEKILKNPKSNEDLLLVEGDILRVPQRLQTVKLTGELLNPVTTRFTRNTNLRNYVAQAGGFSDNARKNKVFVIYANGSMDRTRSFLFFRSYPKIEPGAEIVVPQKPERDGVTLQETLAISSSLSSIALVAVTIMNQLK
ncbi:MAG: SLBB domain-containing protein [Bacteroidales bacterium]|nr:SLBB domain-containing protein [Bacteroidales bacterium]